MQETRRPRNTVLQLSQIPAEAKLAPGEGAGLWLWDRTDSQSLHILKVAKGADLERRYHETHDLVLLCIAGKAIVEVEGERYFLEPPAAAVIPRLYAYRVLPNDAGNEFVAVAVYSPAFDGEDVVLTKDQAAPPKAK